MRSQGIGPVSKWVDDHTFIRVRRQFLHEYNERRNGWAAAVKENGGRLQACAARTAWNRLVRRDVSDAELAGVLAPFESSGRSYRALVRAIVTGDAYRTVQP